MSDALKVLSWNLAHQTREAPIPPTVVEMVRDLSVDVVVFNEFVDGESRIEMPEDLAKIGFAHQFVSNRSAKSNQVFIAANSEFTLGSLHSPRTTRVADANWVHVCFVQPSIELVGFRIPAYNTAAERNSYRFGLSEILRKSTTRPIAFCGDFNLDPFQKAQPNATGVPLLGVDAFIVPRPSGEWSYINKKGTSKSCIDHVAHNRMLEVSNVMYHHSVGKILLTGPHAANPISDHAALTFEMRASLLIP